MSIVLIRSAILYFVVIFSVRLMGKRQLGELQPSELVITILVSNIATLPLEDSNIPLTVGITPIIALVCLEVIMSLVTLKFPRVRCIISGRPKIIISEGKIDRQVMKDLRYSIDDLMTALRANGVFSVEDVQYAVVETTGSISVLKKPQSDTPTCSDIGLSKCGSDPQQIVITDGKVLDKALQKLGLTSDWLKNVLTAEKLRPKEVFLMTADSDGQYNIVDKKEQKI